MGLGSAVGFCYSPTECSNQVSLLRPKRRRRGFTLVELLVVIGIIALLMSILLPTLGRVREQSQAIKCFSQLRQIATAIEIYKTQNDGQIGPYSNWGRWQDPSDPTQTIDSRDPNAYWGVTYSLVGGLPKQVFMCPMARATHYDNTTHFDGTFVNGHTFVTYAINGYGGPDSGWSDAKRKTTFGVIDELALFRKFKNKWIGRKLSRMRNTDRIVLVQDAYEQSVDGNGDTFDNWSQWTLEKEYLRHMNMCNVIFADTHCERLTRQQLSDVRIYSGRY